MQFLFLINLLVALLINSGQAEEHDTCKTFLYRNKSICEQSFVTTMDIAKSNTINLYQSIVHLYDHFHWDPKSFVNVVGKNCELDMEKYLRALNESKAWALRAYDTSGHYRGQILNGNNRWLGQKRFCSELSTNNNVSFAYSVSSISINITSSLKYNFVLELGQCLPITCSSKDIILMLEADPYAFLISSTQIAPALTVVEVRSQDTIQKWTDYRFKIFVSMTIFIFIIVNLASIYTALYNRIEIKPKTTNLELEVQNTKEGSLNVDPKAKGVLKHNKNIYKDILNCLAIQSSIRTILNLSSTKDNLISSIHGLRVFSLLWTILVHTYLQSFFIGENKVLRKLTEQSFLYQLVGNATFSVDSFFFISGLLLSLMFYKQHKKYDGTNTSFIRNSLKDTGFLVFYRYFRLTIVYLYVIFFNEFSMRYGYSDSVFKPAPHVSIDNCANYWWRNILYINNFYGLDEICMIWSWYMANDMQFYILTIIFLILSKRYFRISFSILSTILFSSWIITGLISITYQYKVNIGEPFKSFDFLYDKPWQRIGAYIVGITTGYTLFKIEKPPNISQSVNCFLWICSLGLIFLTVFGVWKGELDVYESALYTSVGHTGYAVGLSWITLSCSWRMTETVNSILSYKGWLPLSRLTYCAYLLHPLIMLLCISTMEGTITLSNTIIVILFLGNVTISLIGALKKLRPQ